MNKNLKPKVRMPQIKIQNKNDMNKRVEEIAIFSQQLDKFMDIAKSTKQKQDQDSYLALTERVKSHINIQINVTIKYPTLYYRQHKLKSQQEKEQEIRISTSVNTKNHVQLLQETYEQDYKDVAKTLLYNSYVNDEKSKLMFDKFYNNLQKIQKTYKGLTIVNNDKGKPQLFHRSFSYLIRKIQQKQSCIDSIEQIENKLDSKNYQNPQNNLIQDFQVMRTKSQFNASTTLNPINFHKIENEENSFELKNFKITQNLIRNSQVDENQKLLNPVTMQEQVEEEDLPQLKQKKSSDKSPVKLMQSIKIEISPQKSDLSKGFTNRDSNKLENSSQKIETTRDFFKIKLQDTVKLEISPTKAQTSRDYAIRKIDEIQELTNQYEKNKILESYFCVSQDKRQETPQKSVLAWNELQGFEDPESKLFQKLKIMHNFNVQLRFGYQNIPSKQISQQHVNYFQKKVINDRHQKISNSLGKSQELTHTDYESIKKNLRLKILNEKFFFKKLNTASQLKVLEKFK